MLEFAGIIGMILIVLAWIPQTLRTIRTKRVGVEPRFLWFYLFGCIGLIIYSIYIKDPIFIGLNSISFLLNLINVYYYGRGEISRHFKNKRLENR